MDPALITPLTEITDYLLKCKPGVVSIQNIVRISQYYGFETFNENSRLTIAGKIILIDIDYNLEEDGIEENIQKIGISLAVDLQNDNWNFMKSFDSLLYNNLKNQTLFKFNNNFKKLSVLDKFSSLKFDLFNYLNQKISILPNIELNLNDNLGYYLPIHENYKYLNDKLNTKDICYLDINIKETKEIMINDLKCGICLEIINADNFGLIIPEVVLFKLGILNYDVFETYEQIPNTTYKGYKLLSLIGSKLVRLRQFYLADLTNLDNFTPVLQNWFLINNIILKQILSPSTDPSTTEQDDTDINLDDYLANDKKKSKLIEIILAENLNLEIKIGDELQLLAKDGKVTSENNPAIADKVNKIEDLYRVLLST